MSMIADVIKNKWGTLPAESTESFTGRNVIVTGGTSGLGYATAVKFAKLGASKIIITARDEAKGETTKKQLETEVGDASHFEVWTLDMNSYDSIVEFSQRVATELEHLDVAILNAGLSSMEYRLSPYGWEEMLQVNTLSTTLLGILLLPKLKAAKSHTGKIPVLQFVNSSLHKTTEIPASLRSKTDTAILAELNKFENFSGLKQYGYSKLLLRYAAIHLADASPSTDIIITSVCPGMVTTNISRDIKFPGAGLVKAVAQGLLFRTAEQGANTYVSGAGQKQELHGRFWWSDTVVVDGQNIVGEQSKEVAERVWREIVAELGKHVSEVKQLV